MSVTINGPVHETPHRLARAYPAHTHMIQDHSLMLGPNFKSLAPLGSCILAVTCDFQQCDIMTSGRLR